MHVLWLTLLSSAAVVHAQPANYSQSLLWGPYRPNLYFGLRPRIPQSLMTGLMWFGTQNYESVGHVRHACDQMDDLGGYSWTEYDPREGGVQVLRDNKNNIKLTTEFLKVSGGNHGGSWATRIKGEAIDPGVYLSDRRCRAVIDLWHKIQHYLLGIQSFFTLGLKAWADLKWRPMRMKTCVHPNFPIP
jgi:mannosyl-oligosaccharide glucosidase